MIGIHLGDIYGIHARQKTKPFINYDSVVYRSFA